MKVYQNNYEIISSVLRQIDDLQTLQKELQNELKKLPQGKIRISISNKTYQFFHITSREHCLGKYISKRKNAFLINQLAQKRYNQALLIEVNRERKTLQKFIRQYKPGNLTFIYKKQHPALKNYIKPYCLDNETFIKNWLKTKIPINTFSPENLIYNTSMGIKVRSKSEVLIAETLASYKIPFRYEYPINLKNFGIIHPDFYCLNPRTLKEIIWEHFGMMDNIEYANNTVKKLNYYQLNGYICGKNLCFTQETSIHPLDIKQIQLVIKNYLA